MAPHARRFGPTGRPTGTASSRSRPPHRPQARHRSRCACLRRRRPSLSSSRILTAPSPPSAFAGISSEPRPRSSTASPASRQTSTSPSTPDRASERRPRRAPRRRRLRAARARRRAFVERTRVLPLVHTRSRLPVDVVLAGPGLEELFFSRVEERNVGEVRVPVAAAEDIVAMKVLAGTPQRSRRRRRPRFSASVLARLRTRCSIDAPGLLRAGARPSSSLLDEFERPGFAGGPSAGGGGARSPSQ